METEIIGWAVALFVFGVGFGFLGLLLLLGGQEKHG